MAEQLADLGFDTDIPVPCKEPPNIHALSLTPQTWFLLSRVDGKVNLRDLLRISGMERQETIDNLRTLSDSGLIHLPNRTSKPVKQEKETLDDLCPRNWPVPLDAFTFDPESIEASGAMPVEMRKVLLYYHYHLKRITYYDLFGLERGARPKQIQEAYYALAKVFHPDRWFRKEIGRLDEPLREVFRWVNKAYQVLNSPERRQEYDRILDRGYVGPWEQKEKRLRMAQAQAKERQGRGDSGRLSFDTLVARARRLRAQGDFTGAADGYQRALRLVEDRQLALELADTLLHCSNRLDDALTLVRLMTAGSSANYTALVLEAKILNAMGRTSDARQALESILAREPGHSEALAELAKLRN